MRRWPVYVQRARISRTCSARLRESLNGRGGLSHVAPPARQGRFSGGSISARFSPSSNTPTVPALAELSDRASKQDLIIWLENEHACNIGTAAETARVLEALRHPNLKVVWDPANAFVAGENPFPDGYRMLPPDRIIHVHAKDCQVQDHTPEWGPLGTRAIDWKEQIAALLQDGYRGHISLETHWPGPGGNKLEASRICGWNLRGLASL
jgi:L-ribulose-5-phosphate 3-epimerase